MADKMMRIAGRTSGGTAVPMLADSNGNIGTTRKWKREWVTVLSDTEIRDTSLLTVPALDLRDVSMCSLRVMNRLGTPVTLGFFTDVNTSNGYSLADTDGALIKITLQPTQHYEIITPEEVPLLNYVQYLRLAVRASEAPETGTLAISAVIIK